ncbi:MAG: hypothetical protein AB4911_12710 [Oscillochloridaceae bacterium umkhey_bin13]
MPITLSEVVAQSFGLRHRPVDDAHSDYRKYDVLAGIMTPIAVLVPLSLVHTIIFPGIVPTWLDSVFTLVGLALVCLGGVFWKPGLEHLGLLQPDEVSASTRQRIVIVARAIPYVYAIITIITTFLFACLFGLTFATLITQAMGIAPDDSSYTNTMLGLGGAIGILVWGFMAHTVVVDARRKPDWGLPTWSAWIEPGQQYPAGQRFFGLLDATLGRFARAITK